MNTQPDNLLTDDHSRLDEMLDRVFTALRDGNYQQIFDRLDYFWARLATHIRAEHLHLFPAVLASIQSGRGGASLNFVTDVTEQLRADHDHFMSELAGVIKAMRELIGDERSDMSAELTTVAKRIVDLSVRLRTHDELEEAEIYPLMNLIFDPAEAMTLNARIKSDLENLPPRFIGRAGSGI